MNHYPRHVGDYLKKTLALTMAQDGAYCRALDWYYSHESPLPLKPDVYGELRCMSRADRDAVNVVLARYFEETPEGYRHKRCDEEIGRYLMRAETARENGRGGGRPKTNPVTKSEPDRLPQETMSGTGSKTSQNQNQNQNHKPRETSEGIPTSEAPDLPGTLTPSTWAAWRSHLANLRKPMTPQAERLQLHRLAGHADPESVVLTAIERGHRVLEPVGGWPDAKPHESIAEKRAQTAREMHGNLTHERSNEPTDITAESQRVA